MNVEPGGCHTDGKPHDRADCKHNKTCANTHEGDLPELKVTNARNSGIQTDLLPGELRHEIPIALDSPQDSSSIELKRKGIAVLGAIFNLCPRHWRRDGRLGACS